MSPMLKQVHLRRYTSLHQRRIKHHAIHHRNRLVIRSRKQKRRRRLFRHLRLRRKRVHQRRIRRIPEQIFERIPVKIGFMKRDHRIRQNQKIRPAPLLFHHIAGVCLTPIKFRSRRCRQVSPRRRSPHPHMVRRHTPLSSMGTHHPYRTPRITNLYWMVILRPQPILQHKRRHPTLIQPSRKRKPLFLHRKMRITTTRRHHHARLRSILLHRQKHRQRRLIVIRGSQSPRSPIRPQQHSLASPTLRNRRSGGRQRHRSRSSRRNLPKPHPTKQQHHRKSAKNPFHQASRTNLVRIPSLIRSFSYPCSSAKIRGRNRCHRCKSVLSRLAPFDIPHPHPVP